MSVRTGLSTPRSRQRLNRGDAAYRRRPDGAKSAADRRYRLRSPRRNRYRVNRRAVLPGYHVKKKSKLVTRLDKSESEFTLLRLAL